VYLNIIIYSTILTYFFLSPVWPPPPPIHRVWRPPPPIPHAVFFYTRRRRLLPLEDFSVGVRHGATVLRSNLCAWRRFPPILLCAWSSSHVLFAAQDHSGIFCTRSVKAMVDILCSIFEHPAAVRYIMESSIGLHVSAISTKQREFSSSVFYFSS
jgi:hypothetical protein